jgi:hypothetical protein
MPPFVAVTPGINGWRASTAASVAVGVRRAWSFQGGFRAFDEDFVVNDRGVEGRDEFEEVGLAFDEVGEEIGIVGGQGLELVEERLLRLQLLTRVFPV